MLHVSPLLKRPLCSDGPFNGPRRGGTLVPVTSPTGHGSASPLIYGKCGFQFFGRPKMFPADHPLNVPPARSGLPYLSCVHSCADHRPVLFTLLTMVFTVKLGDKLALCYRALKT